MKKKKRNYCNSKETTTIRFVSMRAHGGRDATFVRTDARRLAQVGLFGRRNVCRAARRVAFWDRSAADPSGVLLSLFSGRSVPATSFGSIPQTPSAVVTLGRKMQIRRAGANKKKVNDTRVELSYIHNIYI